MIGASIIQAARGPILLITVGLLIVTDYHSRFKFHETWPVLIIVFGVLKLLERMAGPARPPYNPAAPPPNFQPGPGFQAPPRGPGGAR